VSGPIATMLGTGTALPTSCKRFAPDVAVHWYPQGAMPGTSCFCGELVMRDEEPGDDLEEMLP
jgi:hypothetical protein